METAITTVPEVVEQPHPTLPIVAISREDFMAARTQLENLCTQRIVEWQEAQRDAAESYEIAKKNKWRSSALQRAANNAAKMVTYYSNVKEAVAAGYMIVPNLDCDVYAVRTTRQTISKTDSQLGSAPWRNPVAVAETALPPGEGRYVSDEVETRRWIEQEVSSDGKERTRHFVQAVNFTSSEAPVVLARPVLLQAAQRAMAERLFDEIGIVGARRSSRKADPMLVGRILHPVQKRRMVTFFLAWWFDPRSL